MGHSLVVLFDVEIDQLLERQADQAEGGLQRKGVFREVDRVQDSGLGLALWETLLIEAKAGELEEHDQ